MAVGNNRSFKVGDWLIEPDLDRISRGSVAMNIRPQVMELLVYLAERSGQVVGSGKLLDDLWPGKIVTSGSVYNCIAELRHMLASGDDRQTYIETIPKHGYRLVAPVSDLAQDKPDVDQGGPAATSAGRMAVPLFVTILVVALSVGYYALDRYVLDQNPARSIQAQADRSIAVLPFRNLSAVAEDAIFVDGIHDDILMRLAKVSSLEKVISRTSVEQYRDTDKSMSQIGQELDVATILEGGVQRAGDRVRINVQLIDAATDRHLWVESYDRQLTAENLFAIQNEISREIVGALQVVLTDEENARLQLMPTTSLEAHAEFVLGHREMAKRTADELFRARAHFEKAIELDSKYALAYIGLADSLALQVVYADLKSADSLAPREAAIDRALALDPLSGEAYASLGSLRLAEFNDQEAEEYFLKGIELSPNYATAHQSYARALRRGGRFEEALPHIRKAIELDPMAPILTQNLGSVLWELGRVEEAHAILLKGIERNPEFPRLYGIMALQLLQLGRVGEAANWMRAAARLAPSDFGLRTFECHLYIELGAYQSAQHCYDSVEEAFPERGFGGRIFLYISHSQYREAAKLIEQLAQRDLTTYAGDGIPGKEHLAMAYFLSGEVGKARSIWQDLWPELYDYEDGIIEPEIQQGPYKIELWSKVVYG